MHYAEFAEDEVSFPPRSGRRDTSMTDDDDKSAALLAAIKDYENSKWKVIGQKVGKPAKVGPTHKAFPSPLRHSPSIVADSLFLRRVSSTPRSILIVASTEAISFWLDFFSRLSLLRFPLSCHRR